MLEQLETKPAALPDHKVSVANLTPDAQKIVFNLLTGNRTPEEAERHALIAKFAAQKAAELDRDLVDPKSVH